MELTMKRWIALAALACCVGGCEWTDMRTGRREAYERWSRSRARMLCKLGNGKLQVGRLSEAGEKAREAVETAPEFADARMLLGRIRIEQGDYEAAIGELKEAVKLEPKSPGAHYLLGVAMERAGHVDLAIESYRHSYELDERNEAAAIAVGEVLAGAGRTKEAGRYVEERLSDGVRSATILELAGRLAMMNEQYDLGVKHYTALVERERTNPHYQEALGRAHFVAGRFDLARDALATRIAMPTGGKPEALASVWVHAMLGDCCAALGRPDAAARAYKTAVELKPDSASLIVKLAQAHLDAGDIPEAVRAARKALSVEPGHLDAALVLGCCLLRTGRAREAGEVLKTAAKTAPDSPMLLCLLGRCHVAFGRDAEARACYQQALTIDPESRLARELLAAMNNIEGLIDLESLIGGESG